MPRAPTSSVVPGLVRALIEHNPGMLLRELLDDDVLGDHVRNMSLGALFGEGNDHGPIPPQRGAARGAAANGVKPGRKPRANTRNAEGRSDFDGRVLAAIQGASGPVNSETVRKKVGGTPLQVRAATKRLAKSRKIKISGKARGTRYAAS